MHTKFSLAVISVLIFSFTACDSSSTTKADDDNGGNGSSESAQTEGSNCTDDVVQCTALEDGFICDSRDGKSYKTVVIGNQTWMAENLRYVPCGSVGKSWCYANDNTNCETYGRLYTWTAAMNIAAEYQTKEYGPFTNLRGNCPKGFHIPSTADWNALDSFADSISDGNPAPALRSKNVNWANQSIGAEPTNQTEFNALPAGQYHFKMFDLLGEKAFFWLAQEDTMTFGGLAADGREALIRSLNGINSSVGFGNSSKDNGLSIRCIKD